MVNSFQSTRSARLILAHRASASGPGKPLHLGPHIRLNAILHKLHIQTRPVRNRNVAIAHPPRRIFSTPGSTVCSRDSSSTESDKLLPWISNFRSFAFSESSGPWRVSSDSHAPTSRMTIPIPVSAFRTIRNFHIVTLRWRWKRLKARFVVSGLLAA
jgi:hypothetical protein